MTYKVSLQGSSNKSVRLASTGILGTSGGGSSFTIQLSGGSGSGGGSVAKKLTDLNDISTSGAQNRWVLIYDAPTNTFKFVNPDEVVDAAVGANTVPGGAPAAAGLSTDTIDYLDQALDDKIDLDAGTF